MKKLVICLGLMLALIACGKVEESTSYVPVSTILPESKTSIVIDETTLVLGGTSLASLEENTTNSSEWKDLTFGNSGKKSYSVYHGNLTFDTDCMLVFKAIDGTENASTLPLFEVRSSDSNFEYLGVKPGMRRKLAKTALTEAGFVDATNKFFISKSEYYSICVKLKYQNKKVSNIRVSIEKNEDIDEYVAKATRIQEERERQSKELWVNYLNKIMPTEVVASGITIQLGGSSDQLQENFGKSDVVDLDTGTRLGSYEGIFNSCELHGEGDSFAGLRVGMTSDEFDQSTDGWFWLGDWMYWVTEDKDKVIVLQCEFRNDEDYLDYLRIACLDFSVVTELHEYF